MRPPDTILPHPIACDTYIHESISVTILHTLIPALKPNVQVSARGTDLTQWPIRETPYSKRPTPIA